MSSIRASKWTKAGAFLVCLLPLAALGWRAWKQELGANPIELFTHATGDWALRFLLIMLAVTPTSKILSMPRFTLFRRMLGLFAFFYGCLHFLTYLWLDKFLILLKFCLVRGICGSLIRSNGAGKLGSHSRCRMVRASALFPSELPFEPV